MKTVELTKQQLSDVIHGIDLYIHESETGFHSMMIVGISKKLEQRFQNDIKYSRLPVLPQT
jgi:hypothetical protein